MPRVIGKPINLRTFLGDGAERLYLLTLQYCQHLYPEKHLVSDLSLEEGTLFSANKHVRALGYIRKDGI